MNTEKTWQTVSSSSEDTFAVGKLLGSRCKGGETFLLNSDLGGGKTTFVKGLAEGLGSDDHVGSPTFTINRVYRCKNDIELQHFDFYRLSAPGIVAHELSEVIDNPHVVLAIEWGDIVSDTLPERRIDIEIKRESTDENTRVITAGYASAFDYLFKDQS
jgi:tRNA threonylcarbamoyladenosine biosynthesis protein TsaE